MRNKRNIPILGFASSDSLQTDVFIFLLFNDYAIQLMKTQALSSPVLLVSWIFCFTVVYRVSPGVLLWVYWTIKLLVVQAVKASAILENEISISINNLHQNQRHQLTWLLFCCFSNGLWGVLASMWTRLRPFKGSGHHYRFVEFIRMCKVFHFSGKSLENKSLSRESQPRWHKFQRYSKT